MGVVSVVKSVGVVVGFRCGGGSPFVRRILSISDVENRSVGLSCDSFA